MAGHPKKRFSGLLKWCFDFLLLLIFWRFTFTTGFYFGIAGLAPQTIYFNLRLVVWHLRLF